MPRDSLVTRLLPNVEIISLLAAVGKAASFVILLDNFLEMCSPHEVPKPGTQARRGLETLAMSLARELCPLKFTFTTDTPVSCVLILKFYLLELCSSTDELSEDVPLGRRV